MVFGIEAAAQTVIVGDADGRENDCLGNLSAQLGRVVLVDSIARELIASPHHPDAEFIYGMRIDSPIIRELIIRVHYVPGGLVERRYGAERDRRAVVPGCRTGDAVVARYIGIKTPKILDFRGSGRQLV